MIKVISTKSNLIGSKIIKWGLNEEASHFAIQIDYLVIHSNHKGVHFRWANHFYNENEMVDSVALPLSLFEEENTFQSLGGMEGREYDRKAFFYFGFRVLLKKLLDIKMPDSNNWQDPDKDICVELAKGLPSYYTEDLELSVTTPTQLIAHIKSKV